MTVRPVNWTIRAAPPADAPQVSNCDAPPRAVAQAPQPAQATRRLAELIAVYSACMGQPCTRRDIADTLTTLPTAERAAPQTMLAAGLRAAGFEVRVAPSDLSDAGAWPALARMTDGQFILVLERAGSDLVIYDKTCPDNRATVSLDEFAPVFTGLTIRAEVPLDRLAGTHLTDRPRAHWFWGQFADCRRAMGEVILGSFVANLLAVAVALFALQVYDRVIPHQSEATLWVLAGGALLALMMEALLKIARARLMDGAGRQIEMNVQTLLMNRILGMRSEQAGQAPSQLFSAMREFGSVREFFTASTIGTLADVPFIFVFLLLVASIGGNVVWVLILGGILMVLPGIFLQRKMIRLTQETQGASAKSSRLLHEAIFELDTLKTQRAEDRFRRVWTELTALQALKSSEQRQLASVLTFWSQGIQQVTYIAAVIFGTYLVFAGEFTVGSIIAISILTSRTLAPLTQLAGTMARWGNVKSALEGLDAIVNAPQDSAPDRTYLRRERLTGGFELREVKFTYDADMAPVVDIPALVIQPGQKLALLGANGSGKSTLLKLLSGLYAPTSGRLLIDGAEMSQLEPRDLRRLVGYLGQDVRLFTGSLRENLNLTLLESDDDRLLAALDFAGLGPYVKSHPKGLDLEIRDGGQGLSQGQRQSIGWARLWLQDPAICLLDEPTAALDQTLERTLVSRLEGWLEHRTAVIATHRVPILQLTNRTMLLQNGRMAVDGPRDQVLAHLAQRAGAGG